MATKAPKPQPAQTTCKSKSSRSAPVPGEAAGKGRVGGGFQAGEDPPCLASGLDWLPGLLPGCDPGSTPGERPLLLPALWTSPHCTLLASPGSGLCLPLSLRPAVPTLVSRAPAPGDRDAQQRQCWLEPSGPVALPPPALQAAPPPGHALHPVKVLLPALRDFTCASWGQLGGRPSWSASAAGGLAR